MKEFDLLMGNTHTGSTLSSMEFNFNYAGNDGKKNGFKIFLNYSNHLVIVVVSPVGRINPRTKALEIYNTIKKLLISLDMTSYPRKIFLDLLAIKGLSNSNIVQWSFSEVNDNVIDEVNIVDNNLLDDQESIILENYYEGQFTILSNSTLNDKQKIEIIAHHLAPNYYDTFMLDNLMKYFKIFLNKFTRNRIS